MDWTECFHIVSQKNNTLYQFEFFNKFKYYIKKHSLVLPIETWGTVNMNLWKPLTDEYEITQKTSYIYEIPSHIQFINDITISHQYACIWIPPHVQYQGFFVSIDDIYNYEKLTF